jgi:hypothetical protein
VLAAEYHRSSNSARSDDTCRKSRSCISRVHTLHFVLRVTLFSLSPCATSCLSFSISFSLALVYFLFQLSSTHHAILTNTHSCSIAHRDTDISSLCLSLICLFSLSLPFSLSLSFYRSLSFFQRLRTANNLLYRDHRRVRFRFPNHKSVRIKCKSDINQIARSSSRIDLMRKWLRIESRRLREWCFLRTAMTASSFWWWREANSTLRRWSWLFAWSITRSRVNGGRRRTRGWEKKRTNTETTMLSNRIGNYCFISQGKTRIPGVNDGEDMEATDVSPAPRVSSSLGVSSHPLDLPFGRHVNSWFPWSWKISFEIFNGKAV